MNSKNISFSHLKLIEEVKKRPQLYNNDRSINREEKMKLWREVGAAIFSDWSQLKKAAAFDRILFTQKKWRSFRDAYNREVRAQKTGIRPNRSVYKYFKPLLFLGGFDGNPDDIADREYFDAEPLENADESSGESSHDPLINITPKKEKIEKVKKRKFESSSYFNNEDDHEEDQIPVYTYEMEKESNDTDSDKLFLLSFVPEMKQLPLNIKMWARAQISNVMQEAINSQYNNTTPGKELKIFGQDTSE